MQHTHNLPELLKHPRRQQLVRPCQERGLFASLLADLALALQPAHQRPLDPAQHQAAVLQALQGLITLSRKECLEKGLLLEAVREHLVLRGDEGRTSSLSREKEVVYQFERNALRVQQDYLRQAEELRREVEQLRREKEHRWRNMFMVIKDNRLLRRRNRKLQSALWQELDRSRTIAEEMLRARAETDSLRLRLGAPEADTLLAFLEGVQDLSALSQGVAQYPVRARRALRQQLARLQVAESQNLRQKVQFVLNALQQTGELVEDCGWEQSILSSFHYNISTQTEASTQEKAVNTSLFRQLDQSTQVRPTHLTPLALADAVSLRVLPPLPPLPRREQSREGRNGMFSSTQSLARSGIFLRGEGQPRQPPRKPDSSSLSLCESLRISIKQGRIIYISTHNTEIFNGLQLPKTIEALPKTSEALPHTPSESSSVLKASEARRRQELVCSPPHCLTDASCQTTEPLTASSQDLTSPRRPLAALPTRARLPEGGRGPQGNRGGEANRAVQWAITRSCQILLCPQSRGEDENGVLGSRVRRWGKQRVVGKAQSQVLVVVEQSGGQRAKGSTGSRWQQRAHQIKLLGFSPFPAEVEQDGRALNSHVLSQSQKQEEIGTAGSSEWSSALVSPKEVRSELKLKPLSSTMENLGAGLLGQKGGVVGQKGGHRRNQSSIVSALGLPSSSKTGKPRPRFHKRTSTEGSEKTGQPLLQRVARGLPLGRIAEEEQGPGPEPGAETRSRGRLEPPRSVLGLECRSQGVLRQVDFSKGVDRILRSLQMRWQQVLRGTLTFKQFLNSHFKCLYGKDLTGQFELFLIRQAEEGPEKQTNLEVLESFGRLLNPRLPDCYAADLLKTFAATVTKCFQAGEDPLATRSRLDLLHYMVTQFYEKEEASLFEIRMRRQGCFSVTGWFNALELEVRRGALQSQLFNFLEEIVPDKEQTLPSSLIEDLSFALPTDPSLHQHLIRAQFELTARTSPLRLSFFCLRHRWLGLLAIESTMVEQYAIRVGTFSPEQSLSRVRSQLSCLERLKWVGSCVRHWLSLHERLGVVMSRGLLMLAQLSIVEVRLREETPLPKTLKCLGLCFEGLQKKLFFDKTRAEREQWARAP